MGCASRLGWPDAVRLFRRKAVTIPKGPRGEKRPADVIGGAVKVMRIARGEEQDEREPETPASAAAQLGKLGGAARAKKLTPEQRADIARKAAARLWSMEDVVMLIEARAEPPKSRGPYRPRKVVDRQLSNQ